MTTALWSAVELLERSLGYTRAALAAVSPDLLGSPTPCAGWDLDRLLRHMDDSLDAFTEAATGSVSLVGTAGASFETLAPLAPQEPPRLESIRAKACALLGWWCTQPPETVRVGDSPVSADLLVGTAALEITVHGWDVHRALGRHDPVPDELAGALLPIARAVVTDADRPRRFAPPVATAPGATDSARLLGFLGRT